HRREAGRLPGGPDAEPARRCFRESNANQRPPRGHSVGGGGHRHRRRLLHRLERKTPRSLGPRPAALAVVELLTARRELTPGHVACVGGKNTLEITIR